MRWPAAHAIPGCDPPKGTAMLYKHIYRPPEGFSEILLHSDGECLTGLWFTGVESREDHPSDAAEAPLPVFAQTCRWLDIYFSGEQPDFMPPYRLEGLSPFRYAVTQAMLAIPYGEVRTYGELAAHIAAARGGRMSAQAVGGAVGRNPISILIPCHRVMGADNALTGYGGGIQNKLALLALEGHDPAALRLPKPKKRK